MMRWKQEIKESWKKNLAVLLLVTSTNILGCSVGQGKRDKEIWLIDSKNLVLYRVVSDTEELAIPIKNNKKAMDKFMCVDSDEFSSLLKEVADE